MNSCESFREMISMMLDGELSEPQKTELEAHLRTCGECARIYDAFAFISHSIGDDLSEPPASLSAGVMDAVRAEGARPAYIKSRTRLWGRLAALAACAAIVVFAAVKSDIASTGSSLSNRAASVNESPTAETATSQGSAEESASDEAAGDQPESTDGTAEYTDAEATPMQEDCVQTDSPSVEGGDDSSASAPEDASTELTASASLMAISQISVFHGVPESRDNDPIMTLTDQQSILLIMEMLEFSEASDDIRVSGDPIFIFSVIREDGSEYKLSVWIVDGMLCCMSDEDDVLYVAAGTASDLIAMVVAA